MDRRTIAVGIVLITAAEALVGRHEPAIVPGDHPDLGAEWAYYPAKLDRMPFANGSNTRFAFAGLAAGAGTAFDPTLREDAA